MIDISLKTIPHAEQRYDTCGDWRGDVAGQISVTVSELPDWRYEFLVALHELIEGTLCNARGIKDADVSAFDEQFEAELDSYQHQPDDEPGDDRRAPYHQEHVFASAIERIVATELGVDWSEYEQAINAL